MHNSKSTVLPLPVGAEITMLISEWKHSGKHSLCSELKYLNTNDPEATQSKVEIHKQFYQRTKEKKIIIIFHNMYATIPLELSEQ